MHDLIILALIWSCVFIASFMAHRTRLTPVLWYLFLGAIMVNIGLLPEKMPTFIKDFSELGIRYITISDLLSLTLIAANDLRHWRRRITDCLGCLCFLGRQVETDLTQFKPSTFRCRFGPLFC